MLTTLAVLTPLLLPVPAAAGATAASAAPAAPATAPEAAAPSLLSVTSISPAVATPTTPVTVRGTLTARAGAIADPRIRLVRSTTSLSTRDAVTAWAADTAPADGSVLAEATPTPTLAAGAGVAFTLTVPAGSIGRSLAWGTVPVAVEVGSGTGGVTLQSLHSFLGWHRQKEYEPLTVGVVAPVTLSPDTALFSDDDDTRVAAWRTQVGPGSRIDRVLTATDLPGVPVTWAVDPAVLGRDTATTTSGSGATAPTEPDPVDAVTKPLATRLAAAATRHPLWALPYADPDVAATDVAPRDPTVVSEISRAAGLGTRLGTAAGTPAVPVTTGISWPVDGALPPAREQALRTAYGSGLRAALVSGSTLPSTSGFSATAPHRSPSDLPVVGWDDVLSALTIRTRTPAQGALATQELVAQTAALLGQSPGIPRSFLIALPRSVDPSAPVLRSMLTALSTVPWVSLTSADTLVTAADAELPVAAMTASTWPVKPARVDAALLGRAGEIRHTVDTVSALFPDRGALRSTWYDALDQLTSVRWRDDPAGAGRLAAAAAAWTGRATSGIRVVAQDTNFLADDGVLQVTVVNDLPVAVEGLRLRLTPTNPRLRVVTQPAAVTIPARSRTTVNVRVRAVAAGLVPVTATLSTTDGTPVGVPAQLGIRANPPGRTFYVVSGALVGLVLLLGIVRTLRGRRRPVSAP